MELHLSLPPELRLLKERAQSKPISELEMIVRRTEETDDFWIYACAKEELEIRNRLTSTKVGLMFFKEEIKQELRDELKTQPASDFVLRFGDEE